MRMVLILTSLVLSAAGGSAWSDSSIHFTLKHDSPAEQQTRAQLQSLLQRYDLTPYIYTHEVVIDQDAIPHSHPVLTLHTRHLKQDDELLATFMHEQAHWFVAAHEDAEMKAQQAYRALYPKVPVGYPEGAQDEQSTYLHLTVCYLEYQSMKKLVGPERAKVTMEFWAKDHYTWIYKTLLADEDKIGAITSREGLLEPVMVKASSDH
jgi:hypothetical protein